MAAETNLITTEQMKKVREVDFTTQFAHNSLNKLNEILGVTRKIPAQEGTTLYAYTTTGTLQDGSVAEGEIIPLSQYQTTKTPIGDITLGKWRKGVSAEAIKKSGYDAAVINTDAALLKDVQKSVRTKLFDFLNNLTGTAVEGETLQKALAEAWGQAQILFEDDAAEMVYFVNPQDIATYLGNAQITTQEVFGMNYVENFLGLGTVITSSRVSKGTFKATAKQNLVMNYITTGGDLANAFNLTTDETGLIGINSGYQNNERAQIESLVMSGIMYTVDYAGGVVSGTITGE